MENVGSIQEEDDVHAGHDHVSLEGEEEVLFIRRVPHRVTKNRGGTASASVLQEPQHPHHQSAPDVVCSSGECNVREMVFAITDDLVECISCAAQVEEELRELEGVLSVGVSLVAQRVTIKFDHTILSDQALKQALEGVGLRVQSVVHVCDTATMSSLSSVSLIMPGPPREGVTALSGLPGVDRVVNCGGKGNEVRVEYLSNLVGVRDILNKTPGATLKPIVDKGQKKTQKKKKTLLIMLAASFALTLPLILLEYLLPLNGAIRDGLETKIVRGLTVTALIQFVLAIPIQFWIGGRFYKGAWASMKKRRLNVDVLVSISTSAAFFYSVLAMILSVSLPTFALDEILFVECGILITIIFLGKVLELLSKGKASEALRSLPKLAASNGRLVTSRAPDGEERIEQVPVGLLQIGDLLKVLPGEKVPVDGVVVSGNSQVDEKMLTGESIPVHKAAGAQVYGSTINGAGVFYLRVTATGQNTALSKIVEAVARASTQKAPIERFADRISNVFVPLIVLISLITLAVWLSLTFTNTVEIRGTNNDVQAKVVFSLIAFISVLVVACPCALGLATPTAVLVGSSVGARFGILIKSGAALETMFRAKTVVFDKTGTLTRGNLKVRSSEFVAKGKESSNHLWLLVGSAESMSEHPTAKALTEAARAALPDGVFLQALDTKTVPGRGMSCRIGEGGTRFAIGNRGMMEQATVSLPPEMDARAQLEEKCGATVVFLSVDGEFAGWISISDELRPEAVEVIQGLNNDGIRVMMLTGDNERAALAIARQCGIPPNQVIAGVLPTQKSDRIQQLQQGGEVIVFVGDGINDAVALTQSDVGVSIGTGSDIASDASDFVLIRDDLWGVYYALHLSRSTFRRIRLNFVWALGYNLVAVPIAAGVFYVLWEFQLPPAVAAAMEACSTLAVVFSSIALYLWKPPRSDGRGAPRPAPRAAVAHGLDERAPLLQNTN